jgi:hypothetical protein
MDLLRGVLVAACAAAGCGEPIEVRATRELELKRAPLPAPRTYSLLVWEAESRRFVLLGGGEEPNSDHEEAIWTASPNGRRWRLAGALAPGDLDSAAYDSRRDRILVWVSFRYQPEGAEVPAFEMDTTAETWSYRLDSGKWERLATAGSPPRGIFGTRMSYDAESDRFVLFGGFSALSFEWSHDTWVFDPTTATWSSASPATHPTGRNYHGQVYDPQGDRVLVVAGFDETFTVTNDVWAYDTDANVWTRIDAGDGPARDYPAVAHMGSSGRLLLFGGVTYGPAFEEITQGDTWEYDLRSNQWQRIDASDAPFARAWHAIGWSPKSREVVIFGGGSDRFTMTNEVWAYDPRSQVWDRRR